MKPAETQTTEAEMLRQRLSRLCDACLRINESLEFNTVLQVVMDSARSLTGGRYGVMLLYDSRGWIVDYVASGVTSEQEAAFKQLPGSIAVYRKVTSPEGPVRLEDYQSHVKELGLPDLDLPFPVGDALPFLSVPIRRGGELMGTVMVAVKDEPFSADDEETLVLFAAQAALVISNARRHRDERRARADLETLVNTAPVGVLVYDVKSRVLRSVSREAERIIGERLLADGSLQELMDIATFRSPDGREIAQEDLPISRILRNGEAVRAEEIVIEVSTERSVTVMVNATPIRSANGRIATIIATVQDMTPLEDLERLRAEFLGMVSHELRAPLAAIKGSAATALGAASPLDAAEARQFLRIIEEQADQMRGLINNLLDLTRIETETLSVALQSTDVAAVIEQATSAFLSSGHRNTVEVDLMTDLPQVWADRQRLVQVLHNLLTNAAKYSRDWSTITVSASLQDSHVRVSVTDTGVGIASERLPRLFSKFSSADIAAGENHDRSYGLGLAIAKGIVRAHGGRVWAESDGEGCGTTVTFTIPTTEALPAAIAADVGTVSAGSATAVPRLERILVVDDNPQMLRYVRDTLNQAGYTAILTGDPEDVDALLRDEVPHLVLLNLVLPGTDGFSLMTLINSSVDVPVIFMSGRGADRYVARAFEMGAADYIVKPFSPTELLTRISAALRRSTASQHAQPYRLADLTVDYLGPRVTIAGRTASLTPTEHKLLVELCTNSGHTMAYEQILARVWGPSAAGDLQRVRTVIKDLRSKLGDNARSPRYIFTVPGVGYRAGTPRT